MIEATESIHSISVRTPPLLKPWTQAWIWSYHCHARKMCRCVARTLASLVYLRGLLLEVLNDLSHDVSAVVGGVNCPHLSFREIRNWRARRCIIWYKTIQYSSKRPQLEESDLHNLRFSFSHTAAYNIVHETKEVATCCIFQSRQLVNQEPNHLSA